ncbi:MAG: hypothetical protein ACK56F_22705 [bacterium]
MRAVVAWRRLWVPTPPKLVSQKHPSLWSPLHGVRSLRGQPQGAGLQFTSHPSPQPLWPPHGLKWWGGGAYCHLQAGPTALHPQLGIAPPPPLYTS